VALFEAYFKAMHCSTWGRARSNAMPKEQRVNAEWLADVLFHAEALDDGDVSGGDAEYLDYLKSQRAVDIRVDWQPCAMPDQEIVSEIGVMVDGLLDRLGGDVPDLSTGATIRNADAKWGGGPVTE